MLPPIGEFASAAVQTVAHAVAFAPVESAVAGLVLGAATTFKLATTGRILGISGAVKGLVRGDMSPWRLFFLAGLLSAGAAAGLYLPSAFDSIPHTYTFARAVIAGLLVGFGASLGNGCTSGHGLCGLSRLSLRSAAFVVTMMLSGAVFGTLSGSAAATAAPLYPPLALPATLSAAAPHLSFAALSLAVFFGVFKAAQAVNAGAAKAGGGQTAAAAIMGNVSEFVVGAVFAVGLALAGMTKPSKVAAFLGPTLPTFDASLMFVMGGALLFSTPLYALLIRKGALPAPACSVKFEIPQSQKIDMDLMLGAVLFGAGWGIGGICPGPALVALAATPGPKLLAFNIAMISGMFLHKVLADVLKIGQPIKPAITPIDLAPRKATQ